MYTHFPVLSSASTAAAVLHASPGRSSDPDGQKYTPSTPAPDSYGLMHNHFVIARDGMPIASIRRITTGGEELYIGGTKMTLGISPRKLLRPSFFSAVLVFALLLTLPSSSSRVLAQQPDNDDMNRPSAEKPDKDRDKDRDRIKNREKDRDRDKDRDEHRARSQQANQKSDNDITRHELESFDGFLDANPEVARELAKNPSLIDDQNYVNKHQNLARYLQNHPGVREEIRENPQGFMQREKRFENSGEDISNTELRNFDSFLDSHPQISKDLQKNPGLLDDQNYLNSHPELKQFLSTHGGVREQVKEHPEIFMRREQKYERNEAPQR
jgi:hypothetical protein